MIGRVVSFSRLIQSCYRVSFLKAMKYVSPELRKRCRRLNKRRVKVKNAEYVFCWIQQNLRANDNPIIDAAIAAGNKYQLPVVVYHALGQRYPHANDRIHKFILEGSRSLAPAVEARGLRYISYVERPAKMEKGLVYRIAERAAMIVTDDIPAYVSRWQAEIVASKVRCPVIAVDANCLVPMNEFPKLFAKNKFFRRAQTPLREKYLSAQTELEPNGARFEGEFDFEPDDLSKADLDDLIENCDIDHTVKPVKYFVGSRERALEQLKWACENVLPEYDRVRTNSSHSHNGSKISPYLHFGQLSVREIVREVHRHRRPKQTNWKFLDELLSWREFFHHVARHSKEPSAYTFLPNWSRKTLQEHAYERSDLSTPALEEMIHGETYDETWNAAQKQYLLEAWMPNNIRMYWGKTLVGWTKSPEDAWHTACYLNDRFSLDGRDPATYGNIGWCFGKINYPRKETKIYGTVGRPWDGAMKKRDGVKEWITEQAGREVNRVSVPESISPKTNST